MSRELIEKWEPAANALPVVRTSFELPMRVFLGEAGGRRAVRSGLLGAGVGRCGQGAAPGVVHGGLEIVADDWR